MTSLTNTFVQLGLALLAGFLASFIAIPLCKRFGLIDMPGSAPHKKHDHPTPLAGGLVIGFSLLFLILVFPDLMDGKMRGAALAAAVVLIFGLWDDHSRLSAGIKFIGQFIAVGIAIYSGIRIEFLKEWLTENSLLLGFLNAALTFFWLVGITNAFNLVDSMDGIAAGLSSLAGVFFIFVTIESGQPELTSWAAILTGISLALFTWNSKPARYFLGDSGAQTLGFLLAVLALLYNPENKAQASSWFAPILMLGFPIFDTTLVVFSRLRRHLHVFKGGLDHTYHRLMKAGMVSGRVVSLIHLTALILDGIALFAISQSPLVANILFVFCLLLGIALILILELMSIFIPQPGKDEHPT
jgi:UDP-GlcNAc:undecaprenyl-phosphate GlcNAc-1-phosphate transferase